jgi:hypothetical protein
VELVVVAQIANFVEKGWSSCERSCPVVDLKAPPAS